MSFLDSNYLLESRSAKLLYENIKHLPIVDAHNHGDVQEIVDNEGWSDIWEVEGATDHYVWELMRRRGVPEEKVTGSASNKEKWQALATIFPEIAGNPTYEWIHLDLKRRFGIAENICKHTADMIWNKTSASLKESNMKPQKLLKDMNVKIMCTTDAADSSLKYHKKAKEEIEGVKILPTWRPDKVMKIEKEDWKKSVLSLGEVRDVEVSTFKGFIEALQKSHDYFGQVGCVASDHGVGQPVSYPVQEKEAAQIYEKAMTGRDLTFKEINDFKSYMLITFGKMNQESGWVTQLHIGAVRNYREQLYNKLGSDAGGDLLTNDVEVVDNLQYFFNQFDAQLEIVLYFLDPVLEPSLTTIARAFPNLTLGAPWWFNDSPYGMERHLKYISSVDLLSNHAGMVTDSRKLISYGSRTEMFRRVLSNFLGNLVKKGQIPYKVASDLAVSISYKRPLNLFFKKII